MNFQQWIARRKELTDLVMSDFSSVDFSSMSGEGIQEQIVSTAEYFHDATQKSGATELQAAKLFLMTEGRHVWSGYTACTDLAGLVLSISGVEIERFTNRDDDNLDGEISKQEEMNKWAVAKSIEYFVAGAQKLSKQLGRQYWVPGDRLILPGAGDIVLIGGSAGGGFEHVLVCKSVSSDGDMLYSVDGGQVDEGGQCVKNCERTVKQSNGRYWLAKPPVGPAAAGGGSRGVIGHITTSSLIYDLATRGLLKNPRGRLSSFSEFAHNIFCESSFLSHCKKNNEIFRRNI